MTRYIGLSKEIRYSLIMIALSAMSCHADGLDSLIDVARSQAAIKEEYRAETRAFNGVKRALDNGTLKNGQSKDRIKKEYGEPVVAFEDSEKKKEKWVYKPENSSFFEGPKINLYFDRNGLLDEVEVKQ